MIDRRQLPRRVLAEGPEDEAIYGAFVNSLFGENQVFVRAFNGLGDITSDVIAAELKSSTIRELAIILDGDSDPETGAPRLHWPKVRKALAPRRQRAARTHRRAAGFFTKIPPRPPRQSLVSHLVDLEQGA